MSAMHHPDIEKRYYKVSEVCELLSLPASTLRFWEEKFPQLSPGRSRTDRRRYTADDIHTLRMIKYLVHDKGLKIEAAERSLRDNPQGIRREAEAVVRLVRVKGALQQLIDKL